MHLRVFIVLLCLFNPCIAMEFDAAEPTNKKSKFADAIRECNTLSFNSSHKIVHITEERKRELNLDLLRACSDFRASHDLKIENLCILNAAHYLAQGADINCYINEHGITPLIGAILIGANELFVFLLKCGADISYTPRFGATPLMTTIQTGNGCLSEILLACGAPVNIKNAVGYTALMIAAASDREEKTNCLCQLLLNHGADILSRDNEGNTALHFAAQNRNFEVCNLIMNHQKRINESIFTTLLCIQRHKQISAHYQIFKKKIIPLLGTPISLEKIRSSRNNYNSRPYDYYQIDCLAPRSNEWCCTIQ